MNARTILLYLFGHAGAIRRVASSPAALPAGILLVLSAAVARNYDQEWFGSSAMWLFRPLIFSLFSGAWLLFFVSRAWADEPLSESLRPGGGSGVTWSFFGCFWMTAPIAWLYAIPMERMFDPVNAARGNVWLLSIVSLWRVVLMSRVISVIGGMPFVQALGKVLLPASLEVLIVGLVAGMGRVVLAGMGGLRNSPAEDVLARALSASMTLSLAALFLAWVLHENYGRKPRRAPGWTSLDLKSGDRGFPWAFLAIVAVVCSGISLVPQQEMQRSHHAQSLAREKDWSGLVSYLSQHGKHDFPPSIVLPPSPWELFTAADVPAVVPFLTAETPAWVQELYLGHLEQVLVQPRWYSWAGKTDFEKLFGELERLPGGKAMLQRSAARLQAGMSPQENDERKKQERDPIGELLRYIP
jgi:hypothetical protein